MADDAPPQCAVRKDPVAELLGFPPPSAKPPEQDDAKSRMVREDEEEFEARQEDRDEIDPRWDRGDSYRDEGRDFDDTAGAVEDRLEEDRIVDRDDSVGESGSLPREEDRPFRRGRRRGGRGRGPGRGRSDDRRERPRSGYSSTGDQSKPAGEEFEEGNIEAQSPETAGADRPATPSSATPTTAISADAAAGVGAVRGSRMSAEREESRESMRPANRGAIWPTSQRNCLQLQAVATST